MNAFHTFLFLSRHHRQRDNWPKLIFYHFCQKIRALKNSLFCLDLTNETLKYLQANAYTLWHEFPWVKQKSVYSPKLKGQFQKSDTRSILQLTAWFKHFKYQNSCHELWQVPFVEAWATFRYDFRWTWVVSDL